MSPTANWAGEEQATQGNRQGMAQGQRDLGKRLQNSEEAGGRVV